MATFDGQLWLAAEPNQVVEASLDIDGGVIRVASAGSVIGEWERGDITVQERPDGYHIVAEEEELVFRPSTPGLAAAMVQAMSTTASPLASRIRSVSSGESAPTPPSPGVALKESEIWFSYRGRIGVGQYWGRFLGSLVGFTVIGVLIVVSTPNPAETVATVEPFLGVATLFSIWPSTALAWKRLHDTGRSGSFFLLTLIPLVGTIIWLVFSLQQSTPGPNQYGPRVGYRY